LIPDDNTKDLAEIPDNIKEKLDIRSVKWIDDVLQVALTRMPCRCRHRRIRSSPRSDRRESASASRLGRKARFGRTS